MATVMTLADTSPIRSGTAPSPAAGWLRRVRATGLLEQSWLPDAARSWIETPSDGVLVAWFMSRDADWGDVVVWKSAAPPRRGIAQRTEPVQAYQEWPPRFGYWRANAGDERVARILHATYGAWNAAMRQHVKIERIAPSAAVERIRDQDPGVFELTLDLVTVLPGTDRLRLPRRAGNGRARPAITGDDESWTAAGPPPVDPRHDHVRRLVVEHGAAITSFCRRWGKELDR